jgi:hypothetical protein
MPRETIEDHTIYPESTEFTVIACCLIRAFNPAVRCRISFQDRQENPSQLVVKSIAKIRFQRMIFTIF